MKEHETEKLKLGSCYKVLKIILRWQKTNKAEIRHQISAVFCLMFNESVQEVKTLNLLSYSSQRGVDMMLCGRQTENNILFICVSLVYLWVCTHYFFINPTTEIS